MSDSPVVLSSYDPNGRYLCYVTIVLDKQRISVEPTQKAQNEALLNENFLTLNSSSLRVTSLCWVYLNSNETLCILIGLNNGEIWLYSPLGNEVILKLSTENGYQINDMAVSDDKLFALDANDFVYEFSLASFELKSHFKLEACTGLKKMAYVSGNRLLLASHQIFLVDFASKEVVMTYPGHVSPIMILSMINSEYFVSGAENDRFLNIYDINSGDTKVVLVSKSNILGMSRSEQTVVSVVTENGEVEMFIDPLITNTTKRRTSRSKKCSKRIQLVTRDNQKVKVVDLFVQNDTLSLTYLVNATIPQFSQIQWRDISVDQTVEVDMRIQTINRLRKGSGKWNADLAAPTAYKEGNARVTSGDNFQYVEDIIQQLESEQDEHDRAGEPGTHRDDTMEAIADKLVATRVGTSTRHKSGTSTTTGTTGVAGTVTVILSQALQSNDHSLLESVLHNRDERVIRDTLIRLKPALSVVLLERLAERIARQPSRQGTLIVWVKWCLITHGGYLVGIPNLMKTLSTLHSTMKSRSRLLDRLIEVETRLDCALSRFEATRLRERPGDQLYGDDNEGPEGNEEELEAEVEYVEELDDAGFEEEEEEEEEEGEEGSASGMSEVEDSDNDVGDVEDDSRARVNGKEPGKAKIDSVDEESGNSDIEVN